MKLFGKPFQLVSELKAVDGCILICSQAVTYLSVRHITCFKWYNSRCSNKSRLGCGFEVGPF